MRQRTSWLMGSRSRSRSGLNAPVLNRTCSAMKSMTRQCMRPAEQQRLDHLADEHEARCCRRNALCNSRILVNMKYIWDRHTKYIVWQPVTVHNIVLLSDPENGESSPERHWRPVWAGPPGLQGGAGSARWQLTCLPGLTECRVALLLQNPGCEANDMLSSVVEILCSRRAVPHSDGFAIACVTPRFSPSAD